MRSERQLKKFSNNILINTFLGPSKALEEQITDEVLKEDEIILRTLRYVCWRGRRETCLDTEQNINSSTLRGKKGMNVIITKGLFF